ncbi:MAG: SpoIIE family protein phosphatase, partial [Defluviitaleaceae bacterium]|nr:SpoIIE family protein phosphatase [Defluviitaleaceae bacterium]
MTKEKREPIIGFKFSRRGVLEFLLVAGSFFAARALVFDAASPFALAYIGVFLFRGNKFYGAALLSAAGVLINFRPDFTVKYLLAILILCAVNLLVSLSPRGLRESAGLTQGLVVGISAIVAGAVILFIRGAFGVFDAGIVLLEGGLIFVLTLVMSQGVAALTPAVRRGVLTNEELLSILVIAGVITIGVADIHIWLFSLRHFAVALVVLLAAASSGGMLGAVTGMLFGLLLNITGFEYIFFAILLALGGFTAGAVRGAGRVASLTGFVVAAVLAALYFDPTLLSLQSLVSLGLAAGIFMALPKKFFQNINSTPAVSTQENYLEKVQEQVMKRVYDIAGGYSKLAKTFEGRIAAKTGKPPPSKLLHNIQSSFCKNCHKFTACWDKHNEEMTGYFEEIRAKGEKRGKLYLEDAPLGFSSMCIMTPDFMGHLGASLELAKMEGKWQEKVVETKSTIHQQFAGLSSVMYEFAVELSAMMNFQKDMEDRILRELAKENEEVEGLIVIENTLGKYEVSLNRRGRRGESKIVAFLGEIIGRALGREMEMTDEKAVGRGNVRLTYGEKQRYYVHSGIAKINKQMADESGDSFSLIQLRDGRAIAALSDGMGSGSKAKEGSEATIELLEELLEKGFKKDIAIRLINSALLLKSHDEFFSTLDICIFDMNSGVSEFIKIGASASYLMRQEKVEAIGSWT